MLIKSFSFSLGLITAVQVRIGLYLGNGQPQAAKQVAIIGLKVSLLIGSVIGLLFVLLRAVIGKIYSNDPAIWELAEKISVLVGICYALLSFFYTSVSRQHPNKPSEVSVAMEKLCTHCLMHGRLVISQMGVLNGQGTSAGVRAKLTVAGCPAV